MPAYGLDLNTASFKELLTLPGINRFQAYKINEYREIFGYFRTLDELLKVEGVTQSDIDNWGKLVTVTVPEVAIKPKVYVKIKEQKTSGVESGAYRSLHLRVKDLYPRWSAALLLESYPHYLQYMVTGSKALNGNWSSAPRLNKFYLAWTPYTGIDKMYLGDYLSGFAEGVVLDISGRSKPQGLYPGDEPALEYDSAKIVNNSLLNGVSYK